MIRLYDKSHEAMGYITRYRDLKIESDVSTGDKTLTFTYLGGDIPIENEYYIQTETDEFVVKEISGNSMTEQSIAAVLNLEELERKAWAEFAVTDLTIADAAARALEGTNWTVGTSNVTKKRNAGMKFVSSREVIQKLCIAFMCECVYDTMHRTVSFYDEVGESKGTYFLKGLNLTELDKSSDSYDYYTQIFPIGKEGLSIESVNDGKTYLENFQYSRKIRPYIWQDESYTDPALMKEDAEKKLADMSKPYVSYSAKVIDLASQKEEYDILSYHLGDKVKLIDSDTNTLEAQRIVKMTEYPDEPSRNECELANAVLTWEELQERLKDAADIVNSTLTSDGKIRVSDILEWEKELSNSETFQGLQGQVYGINDELVEMQSQLDGQIETWYFDHEPTLSNEPAKDWVTDDQKRTHEGDLFYWTSKGYAYRWTPEYDSYNWVRVQDSGITDALDAASQAQDTADHKRRVFVEQPTPPYDVGDLWYGGTDSEVKVCMTVKKQGQAFADGDWKKYDKYTDDSGLNTFIEGTFTETVNTLTEQADKKAETWYQGTDPALQWTDEATKALHKGDLWFNSSTNKSYIYNGTGWDETKSTPPPEVFDSIDGKAQIFIEQPVPPYHVGDLWFQGADADIKTCTTERLTGEFKDTDWVKYNKYTDDSQLNRFISNEFANLKTQNDKKAETWYQNTDPSSDWKDEATKTEHAGDIWYNTSDGVKKFYRWSGTAWVLMDSTPPDGVMDVIDGKAQIFIEQPVPPYYVGDLWFTTEQEILTCVKDSATDAFVSADWEKKNKYTDDSQLSSFLTGTYTTDKNYLLDQLDKKAETWYQKDDPSTDWNDDQKAQHKGDLWYNTDTQKTSQWEGTQWQELTINPPQEVFDRLDGKAQIFVEQPTPPYNVGDLWFQDTSNPVKVCVTAKAAGEDFADADWEKKDQYIDQSAADSAAAGAVSSQTQQDIFNKLTNNGSVEGIFLDDTGLYINASFMHVDTLSALSANLGSITAGDIQSKDYVFNAGAFAESGMRINLTDTFIRTPHFCTDLYGAYIKGWVNATSGSIGGCLIDGGVLKVSDANITSVSADKISVDKLSALSADLGSITAGSMESSNYDYTLSTTNHFATTGMKISLTDAFIRTPYFCSDAFGAYISGTIYATAGNIGGCLIESGVLKVNDANIASISASKISVDELSALSANLGSITAGSMESADYNFSTGHFSTEGMKISLTDTFIRTPYFCSDAYGAYFHGNVDASTMTAKFNYYIYSPIATKNLRCISSYKNNESDTAWPVVLRFGLHSGDFPEAMAIGGYISCTSDDADFANTTVEVVADNFMWGGKSVSTSTSDKRVKEDISEFTPEHEALYMDLKPVTYKLKNGSKKKRHLHTKTHYGFIAQDISQSLEEHGMAESDMGMICRNDVSAMDANEYEEFGVTDYLYSLRYNEMVALNTHMTQKALRHQQEQDEIISKQQQQIENLLQANALLLSRLSKQEQKVAQLEAQLESEVKGHGE